MTPSYCESQLLHTETVVLVVPKTKEFENINSDTDLKTIIEHPLYFSKIVTLCFMDGREVFGSVPRSVSPRIVINSFAKCYKLFIKD